MPVTPFHFGPGLLLKSVAPRAFSLTAFAISQGAIDIESGYHLCRSEWPLHREIHSLLIAGVVGVLVGSAVWLGGSYLRPSGNSAIQAEVTFRAALMGGLIGGLSHPLLDAIMHVDLKPFWPFSMANPFLNLIEVQYLHLVCVLSGVAGAILLVIRYRRRDA